MPREHNRIVDQLCSRFAHEQEDEAKAEGDGRRVMGATSTAPTAPGFAPGSALDPSILEGSVGELQPYTSIALSMISPKITMEVTLKRSTNYKFGYKILCTPIISGIRGVVQTLVLIV